MTGGHFSYQKHVETNRTHFVPGLFLKGIFPTNESYCNFTYGTVDNFNWTEKHVSFSPELGKIGPYRVIYDVVKYSSSENSNNIGVTYCTHATPEFVYNIVEIVRRWEGPVSIAVYAPYTDAALTLIVINHLCHCYPEMSKLSLHLIYPVNYPPIFSSINNPTVLDSKIRPQPNFVDCSAPREPLHTFRQSEGLTYPVNVARNVARTAATTPHVLVSDVELLPSRDLVPGFISMLSRFRRKRIEGDGMDAELSPPLPVMPEPRMKKFVFVLPVFEVDENELEVPATKEELLDLYAQSKAVYFHRWVCIHCQRFPGLQRWLQRKPSVEGAKVVQVLF
ncbi:hypothetical protein L9F63_016273 [Diploptera punctata]|uniref:N-acetyllactosaminide beta-1,3-N-acetylglucosaminyltransferase n=1 Tax=Diploptera punctata TaxID=6984 RepID=A0AAD8EIG3_DIPPU|nr:hypothetical protein L9F63_016273 [Diploptera punctata]